LWPSLSRGDLWRSKRDGRVFEVQYVAARFNAPARVQLKPANARNLKSTRWLDIENLSRLYDRLDENDEPFSMNDLYSGDVWELRGGKRVEILDRAFIWAGVRWVTVHDQDFDLDRGPVVLKVERFVGARRL
jgi:hypothetical protein